MKIRYIVPLLFAPFLLVQSGYAQEAPGAGRFEIGAFPVGGVFFTDSSSAAEPDFGDFALGATVTFHVNRWIGLEGEFGNALGVKQDMRLVNGSAAEQRSPCMYTYNGNLVVMPRQAASAVVPYLSAGVGGITLLSGEDVLPLGITDNTTFLTFNVGGGTKWYLNERWGLRADYRLLTVDNKPSAPEFFGRDSVRYGHRVYGGLLFSY